MPENLTVWAYFMVLFYITEKNFFLRIFLRKYNID